MRRRPTKNWSTNPDFRITNTKRCADHTLFIGHNAERRRRRLTNQNLLWLSLQRASIISKSAKLCINWQPSVRIKSLPGSAQPTAQRCSHQAPSPMRHDRFGFNDSPSGKVSRLYRLRLNGQQIGDLDSQRKRTPPGTSVSLPSENKDSSSSGAGPNHHIVDVPIIIVLSLPTPSQIHQGLSNPGGKINAGSTTPLFRGRASQLLRHNHPLRAVFSGRNPQGMTLNHVHIEPFLAPKPSRHLAILSAEIQGGEINQSLALHIGASPWMNNGKRPESPGWRCSERDRSCGRLKESTNPNRAAY